MSERKLIIHADDFGETNEISHGIIECLDTGMITSTSIIANMPGTDIAIDEAVKRVDQASFGVHLNLCEGKPLTDPATLKHSNGEFYSKKTIALRAVFGNINLKDVERELFAQIIRIKERGVRISHIDSHKHLHQLPGLRNVVAQLAVKFGIERIRCTLEKGIWPKEFSMSARFSRLIRVYLSKQATRHFKKAGLRHPNGVFDLKELIIKKTHEGRLAFLRRMDGITEMFCHPGTANSDMEKPGSCDRYSELQFLLSDEFRMLIEETPIKLQTFWDC